MWFLIFFSFVVLFVENNVVSLSVMCSIGSWVCLLVCRSSFYFDCFRN